MFHNFSGDEGHGRKLVICIDYGTAFSSVAYALDARCAQEPPRKLGIGEIPLTSLKTVSFNRWRQVPSELAWYAKHELWVWGDDVESLVQIGEILDTDRYQMLKICLEQSSLSLTTREKVQRQLNCLPAIAKQQLSHEEKPRFDHLVSLYLARLWERSKELISLELYITGRSIFQGRVVECSISVPKFVQKSQLRQGAYSQVDRLWSPQLKELMIKLAVRAGLPKDVRLVHEPEAAAIICFADRLPYKPLEGRYTADRAQSSGVGEKVGR